MVGSLPAPGEVFHEMDTIEKIGIGGEASYYRCLRQLSEECFS